MLTVFKFIPILVAQPQFSHTWLFIAQKETKMLHHFQLAAGFGLDWNTNLCLKIFKFKYASWCSVHKSKTFQNFIWSQCGPRFNILELTGHNVPVTLKESYKIDNRDKIQLVLWKVVFQFWWHYDKCCAQSLSIWFKISIFKEHKLNVVVVQHCIWENSSWSLFLCVTIYFQRELGRSFANFSKLFVKQVSFNFIGHTSYQNFQA